jgi:hypothetical protein
MRVIKHGGHISPLGKAGIPRCGDPARVAAGGTAVPDTEIQPNALITPAFATGQRPRPLAFFPIAAKLLHYKVPVMEIKEFTVLLVEDDINDIFLVKRAFKMAQLENPLQVVTDGEEATHYLSGHGKYADRQTYPIPKLIVMDIK